MPHHIEKTTPGDDPDPESSQFTAIVHRAAAAAGDTGTGPAFARFHEAWQELVQIADPLHREPVGSHIGHRG